MPLAQYPLALRLRIIAPRLFAMDAASMAAFQKMFDNQADKAEKVAQKHADEAKKNAEENNAYLGSRMDEFSTRLNELEEKRAKEMADLRTELRSEFMEKIVELTSQLAAIKVDVDARSKDPMVDCDPWQGAAAMLGHGNGGGNDSKRRKFEAGSSSREDPRNQRNPLRLHIKGFHRAVPPAVHRKMWSDIATELGPCVKGARPRIGRLDYKFQVDFTCEAQALTVLELINNLDKTWIDPKDDSVKSTIRAQTDKSQNAKKMNKIYGEMRKMMESHILNQQMDPKVYAIRTSGPQGPLYVEFGEDDGIDICKVIKNQATGEVTFKVNPEALEPLKINEETLKNMYTQANEMASRWE